MIFITIPTGFRSIKARVTILKWEKVGFPIIAYAWDVLTYKLIEKKCHTIYKGNRKSFAILQNKMIKEIKEDWDGIICGADDLWPGVNLELLDKVVKENQGKVIWVYDGLNPNVCTHPIITKGWYEKYNFVFDENFIHNCCDTDLMLRTIPQNEMIKIEGITIKHKHPIKTPLEERDVVYRMGYSTLEEDRRYFTQKHKRSNPKKLLLENPIPIVRVVS